MPGFNTGALTRKMFEYTDKQVLEPKKGELLGRRLFPVKTLPDRLTDTYKYFWKERMGQASDVTNRATDLTTTDVTYHEEIGYITEKAVAVEYSQEDIDRANKAGIDVLGDKTTAAHDALNDWDDRLIFNGKSDSRRPIYGLTSDPEDAGFQTAEDAPITLASIFADDENDATDATVKKDPFHEANKLVNWFMDAAEKITLLPGYSNVKPVLALPPKEYKLLSRPLLNQYTVGQTVYKLLQGDNPVFSKIVSVEELKATYWNNKKGQAGNRNCGMIYVEDPNVAHIVDAMPAQQYGRLEYSDEKYKIRYKERTGGLCIKFPSGFVRLNGLNDGKETWAQKK